MRPGSNPKAETKPAPRTVASIAAAAVVAVVVALAAASGCRPVDPVPPEVPGSNLDPALRDSIAAARSNVLSSPRAGAVWGRLGQTFDAADFSGEAQACYAEATRREPGAPRWFHLLGLRQLQEAPDAALSNLTAAARSPSNTNDATRLRLAQALIERARFAEATNELAVLLGQQPAHAAGRVELARALLALGQAQPAPELLAPCLTNPYTARPAHLLMGQARLRLGDSEAAARHARIALSLPKPFDWPDAYLREVQELRRDRGKLAEQANALVQQRRLPEAEAVVTNLLARVPDDAEGLLLLGRLRLQQQRCPDAEAALERHLAVRPDSLNGLVQLGMALYCQSRWEESARAFGRAVALKPDFAQAHFNRGLAQSRAGDAAGAIASLREALRCSPGDANTHAALAEELFKSGESREGTEHLNRALALDPRNLRAGALRERLGPGRR